MKTFWRPFYHEDHFEDDLYHPKYKVLVRNFVYDPP